VRIVISIPAVPVIHATACPDGTEFGGHERSYAEKTALRKSFKMQEEASYLCDSCGEEIVIPLDISAGNPQQYHEDCPVCCRANALHIEWLGGEANVRATSE
jgi:hypothetical protein